MTGGPHASGAEIAGWGGIKIPASIEARISADRVAVLLRASALDLRGVQRISPLEGVSFS